MNRKFGLSLAALLLAAGTSTAVLAQGGGDGSAGGGGTILAQSGPPATSPAAPTTAAKARSHAHLMNSTRCGRGTTKGGEAGAPSAENARGRGC